MFVRSYDEVEKKYYKSIVYGLIDSEEHNYAILFNPYINCFELVLYRDYKRKDSEQLYECINSNTDDWVYYERTFLLKLKRYFKENKCKGEITRFGGYKEVFNNFEFMLKIFRDEKVLLEETSIRIRDNNDIDKWTYIRNQEDADEFSELIVNFNSIYKELYIINGFLLHKFHVFRKKYVTI